MTTRSPFAHFLARIAKPISLILILSMPQLGIAIGAFEPNEPASAAPGAQAAQPAAVSAYNELDPTFAPSLTDGDVEVFTSQALSSGKTLVGGGFSFANGVEKNTLARLNADGTLDNTWNAAALGPNAGVYEIVELGNGKILIAGAFTSYNLVPISGVARLNSDGTLDATFNPGGAGTTGIVQGMSVQADGKILISSGSLTAYNGTTQRSVARLNSDGTFDNTFVSPFATNVFVESIVPQPDGKVLIGGNFNLNGRLDVTRLNADGSPDASFNAATGGTNGLVYALALQPDGKILIGGDFTSYNGVARALGARLNADGSLDMGFTPPPVTGSGVEFFDILPDGRILIAGLFNDGTGDHVIGRLNPDGSPDDSFEDVLGNNTGYHVTRQADGKILLGGFTNKIDGTRRNFVRLDADGLLDATFNPTFNGFGYAASVVQQTDGKVVAAGNFNVVNGAPRESIARFNADGSVDASFDSGDGTFADPFTATRVITVVTMQPNGKILIGGNFGGYRGFERRSIARINSDGSVDMTFNPTVITSNDPNATVTDILVQPDGKVVVVGNFFSAASATFSFAFRLNSDGSPDSSFVGGANTTITRIVRQPDGKFIVAGAFTTYSGQSRNRIARINADGTLDATFNPGTGADAVINSLTLQPDGKVLIGGGFLNFNGTPRSKIARLNSDGSLDNGFDPGSGANGTVEDIKILPDGKLFLAGRFSTFNGATMNRLTILGPSGSLDPNFTPGFDGDIRFFARRAHVQLDGKILVSGLFQTYNGQTRNAILRLHTPDASTGGDQPILFTSNRDGNNEIYRMNPDGTNQQRLTNAPESEGSAKWSPDGKKIVYTKTISNTNMQVWTMNADGSGKTLISDASGINFVHDWSPTGQKILFAIRLPDSVEQLWTMNPDGSNKTQLTFPSNQVDHIPDWAPDGSQVAFGRCGLPAPLICDVHVVNADGTGLTNLTPGHIGDDDAPKFTPDGSRIAWARGNDNNTKLDTWVMNSDGSNQVPLTNVAEANATTPGNISPDGSNILLQQQSGSVESFEILKASLVSNNIVNLTNNASADVGGLWSPTGDRIVFQSRRDGPTYEIYLMNADGTDPTRLTFNTVNDTLSDWYHPKRRAAFDFDGDGRSDVSIYRPSEGTWYLDRSSAGFGAVGWGLPGDKVVAADYDGDGKADPAVFRDGAWWMLNSTDGPVGVSWGLAGDVPVPADYDGDGKADIAVFREGAWWILRSTEGPIGITWGLAGDVPVPADYDADGKMDIAVFRDGAWWILYATGSHVGITWGLPGDKPVPADYDGDGADDVAVFREGAWWLLGSTTGPVGVSWGLAGDTPVPADYDGDGRADFGVFRGGDWWILHAAGPHVGIAWGNPNDIAVPARQP